MVEGVWYEYAPADTMNAIGKNVLCEAAVHSMSILFVTTVDTTVWSFLMPYMRELRRQGWRVEVAASPNGCTDRIRAEGFTVHSVSLARSPLRPANVIGALQLLQMLRHGCFDLVHVQTPIAGFLGRWAAHKAGTPCVVYTAHGFHFHEYGRRASNAAFVAAERLAGRWTDVLVTINRDDYAAARAIMPAHRPLICYVPGVGLDPRQYDSRSPERVTLAEHGIRLDGGKCVIAWVGEFNPGKRPLDALRVAVDFHRRGLPLFLVMAGEGRLLQTARTAVSRWGLESVCRFVGNIDWIPDLLAGSDIFMMTSQREGLPRAMMEAMAAGLPVVAYSIRGVRDLVQDGVSGRLVRLGDTALMTDAVAELVTRPDEARRMGDAGRATIQQRFSLEVVMPQMMSVYDQAAGIATHRRNAK